MEDKLIQQISKKNERAQSLVEMAISLVLILTLLSGAVDFGIALYSYVAIRDAAQEGALYASIDPTNVSEIEERVFSSSDKPVDLRNDTSVTATVITTSREVDSASALSTEACEGHGSLIRVDVSYDYNLIMPFLPDILGIDFIPLVASVTDAILQPTCEGL